MPPWRRFEPVLHVLRETPTFLVFRVIYIFGVRLVPIFRCFWVTVELNVKEKKNGCVQPAPLRAPTAEYRFNLSHRLKTKLRRAVDRTVYTFKARATWDYDFQPGAEWKKKRSWRVFLYIKKKKNYTHESSAIYGFASNFERKLLMRLFTPINTAAFGVKPKIVAVRVHSNAPAFAFTLDPIRRDQCSSAARVCVQITVTT